MVSESVDPGSQVGSQSSLSLFFFPRTVSIYYGNIAKNKLFGLFKAIKENKKYMDINGVTDPILHFQNRRRLSLCVIRCFDKKYKLQIFNVLFWRYICNLI